MTLVTIIILTVIWIICETLFIISRRKNPHKWISCSLNKRYNKKYHLVQNTIFISGCILFLAWVGVFSAIEHEKEKAIYDAEMKERENHYKNLNPEILCKFDSIGIYHSQVEDLNDISPHFQVKLLEDSVISPKSKLIACGVNENGAVKIWQPLNDELLLNDNYSECKDSIDYIVCLSSHYDIAHYDKYERGGNVSEAEKLFVQIFDYKTLTIVDTLHIDKSNPSSITIYKKRGQSTHYHAIINVSPEEAYSTIFRMSLKEYYHKRIPKFINKIFWKKK